MLLIDILVELFFLLIVCFLVFPSRLPGLALTRSSVLLLTLAVLGPNDSRLLLRLLLLLSLDGLYNLDWHGSGGIINLILSLQPVLLPLS